jgi:hypothetical protein
MVTRLVSFELKGNKDGICGFLFSHVTLRLGFMESFFNLFLYYW